MGPPSDSSRRGVVAMVAATALWGATFIMVRDTLHGLPPFTLMATRFGLASLAWVVVLALRRLLGGRPRGIREAWIGGLVSMPFTAGGYAFQTIGLTATSAGSSAFLTSTGTLMAAFLAWPLLAIRPGHRLLLGIALAALGSALLGLRSGLVLGRGEAWTLLGALVYALQIVVVAPWAERGADPWLLVAIQMAGTAAISLPFAHGLPERLASFDAATWWRLGYLVLAGAVTAPLLQVMAQRTLPPGRPQRRGAARGAERAGTAVQFSASHRVSRGSADLS